MAEAVPPVLPPEFEAVIVQPDDNLATIFLKVFVKFPRLWAKLTRYLWNSDGSLTESFCRDLRTINCQPEEEEE